MKKIVLYVHGKNGSPAEAEFYKPLFPSCDVVGLDYTAQTPWEAKKEFTEKLSSINSGKAKITLIANSIGAFFSMHAFCEKELEKAYFISPIVDMEELILNMMKYALVSEKTLQDKKIIPTAFGEDLSWDYLCFVRNHPVNWKVPTAILYGENDNLTPFATIKDFADKTGASLTVMGGGEHWFHTKEQIKFLTEWIKNNK